MVEPLNQTGVDDLYLFLTIGRIIMADIIKSITPYGVIGLAIVVIYLINHQNKLSGWKLYVPIIAIIILVLIDKLIPAPKSSAVWVDTGTSMDWGFRDYAYSIGNTPKYIVGKDNLCNASKLGYVATCWDQRPSGYPNVTITDIPPNTSPAQWCTYKNSQIKLSVPPDGTVPPGRVYICATPVSTD